MLFYIIEALLEKKKCGFGHATGIVVILGILASLILYKIDADNMLSDLRFKESTFFHLILPAIVFPSGYNMRRKKYFKNIGTIMKFGFIATMVCFLSYFFLTYAFWKAGLLRREDPNNKDATIPIPFGANEIVSMAALLCSSDVIAAISMIKYED